MENYQIIDNLLHNGYYDTVREMFGGDVKIWRCEKKKKSFGNRYRKLQNFYLDKDLCEISCVDYDEITMNPIKKLHDVSAVGFAMASLARMKYVNKIYPIPKEFIDELSIEPSDDNVLFRKYVKFIQYMIYVSSLKLFSFDYEFNLGITDTIFKYFIEKYPNIKYYGFFNIVSVDSSEYVYSLRDNIKTVIKFLDKKMMKTEDKHIKAKLQYLKKILLHMRPNKIGDLTFESFYISDFVSLMEKYIERITSKGNSAVDYHLRENEFFSAVASDINRIIELFTLEQKGMAVLILINITYKHANIIIINHDTQVITLMEPHVGQYTRIIKKGISHDLRKMYVLTSDFNKRLLTIKYPKNEYKYDDSATCPIISIQSLELGSIGGFCTSWSVFTGLILALNKNNQLNDLGYLHAIKQYAIEILVLFMFFVRERIIKPYIEHATSCDSVEQTMSSKELTKGIAMSSDESHLGRVKPCDENIDINVVTATFKHIIKNTYDFINTQINNYNVNSIMSIKTVEFSKEQKKTFDNIITELKKIFNEYKLIIYKTKHIDEININTLENYIFINVIYNELIDTFIRQMIRNPSNTYIIINNNIKMIDNLIQYFNTYKGVMYD